MVMIIIIKAKPQLNNTPEFIKRPRPVIHHKHS